MRDYFNQNRFLKKTFPGGDVQGMELDGSWSFSESVGGNISPQ
jgi:hypothetical protein